MGSQFTETQTGTTSSPFKVLVIGGSYAGLSAALNLLDLSEGRAARQGNGVIPGHEGRVTVDVTIVDERDGFYHLIGSPLALADEAYAAKAWVKYSDLPALQVPNIHVLQGTVKTVDCASKAATFVRTGTSTTDEEQLSYDYMVVASGLRRAWPVVPQSLRRKQFLFEAGDHINAVTNSTAGVVVVGGGAVGIEMAAELKLVHPQAKVTLVHSRDKLLSSEPLPDECKDRAMELIREAGVDLLMSHRVEDTAQVKDASGKPATEVSFTNGHTMQASVVIVAISKAIPSTSFLPAEALESNGRGHVRIRPNLMFPSEVPNADSHLAIGDVVAWSGIKRCGGAMHMGYFAAANMHEMMLEKMHVAKTARLNELAEIAPMIGLAVGKKAVSYGPAQGVLSGEDVMKAFFGNDLGFDICWNYMKLGEHSGDARGGGQ